MKEKIILLAILVLAVIMGFGAYSGLTGKKPEPSKNQAENTKSTKQQVLPTPIPTPTPTPSASDFVMRIAPQKAGISLVIDYLEVPKASWIVIHKSDGGKPGEIIGELIPIAQPGIYKKIAFISRDQLVSGKEYVAMVHVDDGDVRFKFPGPDNPAKDSKGEVIMQPFTVR